MRRPLSSSETHEVPSGRRASGHSPRVPAPGSVGQPGASCGRDHHLGKSLSIGMVSQGGTTSKGRFGAWLRNLENGHVLFLSNENVEGKAGGGGARGQARAGAEEQGRGLQSHRPQCLRALPGCARLTPQGSRPAGCQVTRHAHPRAPPGQDPGPTPCNQQPGHT